MLYILSIIFNDVGIVFSTKKIVKSTNFLLRKTLISVFFFFSFILSKWVFLSVLLGVRIKYLTTGVYIISKQLVGKLNSYDHQNLHGTHMCHWYCGQVKVMTHIYAIVNREVKVREGSGSVQISQWYINEHPSTVTRLTTVEKKSSSLPVSKQDDQSPDRNS